MEFTELVKDQESERKLAIVAKPLSDGRPGNFFQIQIEQDDQDAYIDLWLSEAKKLRDKLDEWIKSKED